MNLVIWANHNLRASVDAMQKTSAQIFKDQSLSNVESKVVPVAEVREMQIRNKMLFFSSSYFDPRFSA